MANIIIPPEHQSAPKDPPRIVTQLAQQKTGTYHRGDFDSELDMPEPEDPGVMSAYREFAQRRMSKSPEQTVEAAMREYEKNYNDPRTQAQRWKGQERWQGRENEEMRMVRIMHPHRFIWKLRDIGINATINDPIEWVRDNLPCQHCGRLAVNHTEGVCPDWSPIFTKPHERLWLNSFTRVGRVGLTAIVQGRVKTVTTLQYPCGPEWSIMRFDRMNIPTNERYRGWRTALLCLILANVITEEEAHKAFGPPLGPAGEFYREQLFYHRAMRLGIIQ